MSLCRSFSLLTLILATQIVYAEPVDYLSRFKFVEAAALKNSKQDLCKGRNHVPGQLIAGLTSASGDWTSYKKLIASQPNPNLKDKLGAKSTVVAARCARNSTRKLNPIINDSFWWHDTADSNSLLQEDAVFTFEKDSDNQLNIRTQSEEVNVHSHYTGLIAKLTRVKSYLYTGQFKIAASDGGVGVTFLSDYPNSDSYYRLRRYDNNTFHLATHPDTEGQRELVGVTDTGVLPEAGKWYDFEVLVSQFQGNTRIQAKVWDSTLSKPATYQVDVIDQTAQKYSQGLFGIWSMSTGDKFWRKLKVKTLTARP